MNVSKSGIAFAVVVVLSVAQVCWWVFFQFRETHRLEHAAQAFAAQEVDELREILGVATDGAIDDRFQRQRRMFIAEGMFLGLCGLIGVVVFYMMLRRERLRLEERERFLTGSTHEFKTPLATIKLAVDTIRDGRVTPTRQAQYLAAIASEADRLERGISNLLTAAGLRTGSMVSDFEPGDLCDDVANVIDEFGPRYDAAGVALRLRCDESAVPIDRDESALRTVVRNLIDNALRYSELGGAVEVTIERDDDHAELRVSDDGAGMGPDEIARVFEPFFRGRNRSHVGGSGLGLHLVDELVRAHGGRVVAQSDGPGAGSRFIVRLPIDRRAAPRNDAIAG